MAAYQGLSDFESDEKPITRKEMEYLEKQEPIVLSDYLDSSDFED